VGLDRNSPYSGILATITWDFVLILRLAFVEIAVAKAKKRKVAKAAAQPILPIPVPAAVAPQLMLGYDPTKPTVQRKIVKTKEGWSEFRLDDGSVIQAKAVILDVKRAVDQFNIEGNPVYIMQMTMVHNLIAPSSLKKKQK
jgi:hypothetical protein